MDKDLLHVQTVLAENDLFEEASMIREIRVKIASIKDNVETLIDTTEILIKSNEELEKRVNNLVK